MLVPDLLRKEAARDGARIAVQVDGGERLTCGAWEASSNRLSRGLVALGVAPGDRVALLFDNSDALSFLRGYMAAHKAGAVCVPLDARSTAAELAIKLDHCEPAAVLAGAGQEAVARQSGHPRVLGPGDVAAAMDGQSDAEHQVPRAPADLCDILYTSGTTGRPKGVACTHENVTFRAGRGLDIFRGGTFLHAIPLHTFAGTHAMTLMPLRSGLRALIQPRFDAARFVALLAEEAVTVAYAVPSMVLLMLEEPRVAEGGFERLFLLMYGTAPMPPSAIARLAEVLPSTRLLNLYGLTEGGSAVCLLPPEEAQKRPGSIGKPLPPTELRIVDDEGAEVPAGEAGEIWLRAPVRARRYYRDEEATREAFTDDGWVRTGDIGRVDEDGYLTLVDRKKDLIIRGGHNISAPEVEGVLVAHPGVREAAVVGVPHPVLGEDTRAFVVRAEGATLDAEALEAWARERLASNKVPRSYRFVAELPRNALGKVLKRELRERREHEEATA